MARRRDWQDWQRTGRSGAPGVNHIPCKGGSVLLS
jgi:hypothetical protein